MPNKHIVILNATIPNEDDQDWLSFLNVYDNKLLHLEIPPHNYYQVTKFCIQFENIQMLPSIGHLEIHGYYP